MRRLREVVVAASCLLFWTQMAAASVSTERVEGDAKYVEKFEQGIKAFRIGELGQAERAFQEAYLMRPTDSELLSWLALVRDEQARREAMTRAVHDVQQKPKRLDVVQADAAPTADHTEPLTDRLHLSPHTPLGLEQAVTPVEESRLEILEVGKRAGFKKLYKEGIGFQPIHGLGISGRTEIFAEPDPVESLILDTKKLGFREISQFRRSILPLFTRSAAGRIVADYEPLPRVTYEYDARTTLHQYQTQFAFKDIDLQTHAVNALYSLPRIPLLGVLTLNPWYKRVLQRSDHDLGSYEDRDELIANFSLRPNENIEYFFQFDGYNSVKQRTVGGSKLKLYKGQIRLRVPSLRLFAIPSFEYSYTSFDPGDDVFTKKDLFVDWGFDVTKHLRASTKQELILTDLSQPGKIPSNPDTEVFNWTNTLSYELFKDLDVSFGLDHSRGFGYSNYNNIGLRAEVQLFKPGLIRSKLGYEWISYYNIQDDLSLLYWRFFLFQ